MIKTRALILFTVIFCSGCDETENIPIPSDNGHKLFAIGCNNTGTSGCIEAANTDCPTGYKTLTQPKRGEWKMVVECLDDGRPQ